MKKYITIAALLVAGTAFVNAATPTIATFVDSGKGEGYTVPSFDGVTVVNYAMNGADGKTTVSKQLDNDVTLSIVSTGGKFWNYKSTKTTEWKNTIALKDFNDTLGLGVNELESSDLLQPYVATAAGGSISTLTFDFSKSSIVAGTELAFYFVVVSSGDNNSGLAYSGFNVSAGLADVSVSWATAAGTGYTNATLDTQGNGSLKTTNLSVPNDELALIKVTGTLADSQSVAFTAGSGKNGWAMASYTVVPEPSAFGLLAGIGALALVASRRRRK